MEYLNYILVVVVILVPIGYLIHLHERNARSHETAARTHKSSGKDRRPEPDIARAKTPHERHQALQRELRNVPTPWGWPGHDDGAVAGQSGAERATVSLQRWVERLIREKRTLEDQEYQSRRTASLRTMMEDRYGRSSRMQSVEYRKVKPPLLRDPSAPHDQMDNFPSGKGDQIAARLRGQAPTAQELKRIRLRKVSGLEGIKTPWGW